MRILKPVILSGVLMAFAFGQPETAPPAFEVASIHPSRAAGGQYTLQPSPGGFRASNVPLSYLIMQAYKINDYQLVGGPSWISDRYDVAAKPGGKTADQHRAMLQHLLEDRFKLKVHRETREQTEYALTIAKGGPKLKTADNADCPAERRPGDPPCGRLSWSRSQLEGRKASLQMLVFVLSQAVARTVTDETGLQGSYDMALRWTPESALAQAGPDAPPSLFTAVQEQMGLRLQARKGATEVIVVDHVERPTEN
jgi:uncharacterized protein (TIGR03435 family)